MSESESALARNPERINNFWFTIWALGLFAMVGIGASICTWGPAWVMPGFMLPFVYSWISCYFVSWTKDEGYWPAGPRTFLTLINGAMAIFYVIGWVTHGWQ